MTQQQRDRLAALGALLSLAGLVLLLSGCSPTTLRAVGVLATPGGGNDGVVGSPLARATDGASASFSLMSCVGGAPALGELIIQLNQQGIIAMADGPGTSSRVVLNLCAGGGTPLPVPPVPPARSR